VNRHAIVPVRDRRRLWIAWILALAALALIPLASAGASGNYKGKTKQKLPVAFRATSSSVVGFRATASVFCMSANKSQIEIRSIAASPHKGRIKAGGKFTLIYVKGGDHVTVSGKVGSSSASGRLEIRYSKWWQALNSATGFYEREMAACQVTTTWIARRT
jgi:hypothetical protein